jgi:hypothetical protein
MTQGRPVAGVPTRRKCVSIQTKIAYASVFGGDTNHGAKVAMTQGYLPYFQPQSRYDTRLFTLFFSVVATLRLKIKALFLPMTKFSKQYAKIINSPFIFIRQ